MSTNLTRLHHQMRTALQNITAKDAGISQRTLEQYRRDVDRAIPGYFDAAGVRDIQDMPGALQGYVDHLAQTKSAGTVRAYFSAVTKALNASGVFPQERDNQGKMVDAIRADKYELPERRGGGGVGVTKGRDDRPPEQLRPCQRREASPRVWDFAARVGVRKGEYMQLQGSSLKRDESGHLCVEVFGKGGKLHKQRIEPKNIEFVKGYFEGLKGNDKVFTREELKAAHDQNLHGLRREHAQEVYARIKAEVENDPKAAKRVYNEIKHRFRSEEQKRKQEFEKENEKRKAAGLPLLDKEKDLKMPTPLPSWKQMQKPLVLRGGPKEAAIKAGKDYQLNRLAAYYTSVFVLSHWTNTTLTKHYYT